MVIEGGSSGVKKSEDPLVYAILSSTADLKFESSSLDEGSVVRDRIATKTRKDDVVCEDFILRNFTGRLRVQKRERKSVTIAIGHRVFGSKEKDSSLRDDDESAGSFVSACEEGFHTDASLKQGDQEESDDCNVWEPGPGSLLHDLCGKEDVTLKELQKALRENPKAPFLTNQWGQTPLHILSENLIFWNSPYMSEVIDKIAIDPSTAQKSSQKCYKNASTLLSFGIELLSINPIAIALYDSEGRLPFLSVLSLWTRRQLLHREDDASSKASSKPALLDWMNRKVSLPDKLKKSTKAEDNLSENLSADSPASFVQIGGTTSFSTKFTLSSKHINFPQAKLTNAASHAIQLISYSFAMTTTRGIDGTTTPFPIKLQQKLRDTMCKEVVKFTPYFLPTLFFIEPEVVRAVLFRQSLFIRRLLLENSSVLVPTSATLERPWILTMLKGIGSPSERAVDYFELVSSLTVLDYTNNPHDDEEKQTYENSYITCLRDAIADMGLSLIPSLSALPLEEIERAAYTSTVVHVIQEGLNRPFVTSFALVDLVLLLTLIMAVRTSLVNTHLEFKNNGIIYFICMFNLVRQLAQGFALFSLSRTIFKKFVKNAWNIFQFVATLMIFFSSIANDALSDGNIVWFDTIVMVLLWMQLLSLLRTISKPIAALILALIQCVKNLRPFLVVVLIIVLMFGDIMKIISNNEGLCQEEESDLPDNIADFCSQDTIKAALRMYAALIGDFEFANYDENSVMYTYFILFTLVGVIVLTNLLIAVVSDAYVDAMAKSKGIFGRSRVTFLSENLALEQFLLPGTKLLEGLNINRATLHRSVRDIALRILRWAVLGFLCVSPFMVVLDHVRVAITSFKQLSDGITLSIVISLMVYGISSLLLIVSLWTIVRLLLISSGAGIDLCYSSPLIGQVDRFIKRLLQYLRKTIFRDETSGKDKDREKTEMMENLENIIEQALVQSERNIGYRIKALENNIKEHNAHLVFNIQPK
mmetsp:Transcript_24430/g.36910  ORF Transcript_24430/g.36910 Transcript_24430/m.36910 type:complete len:986 (+) Transcript_24430:78-3035(+)